ncbi:MAG: hypothetical protein GC162_03760 [Planctomycetes bacterium]|nr:hypothetical protein [Planctomycetota bacterium]
MNLRKCTNAFAAWAAMLSLGGALPAGASAAQLLTNGSFETGTLSGWTHTGGAGDFIPTTAAAMDNRTPTDGTRALVWNGGGNTPNGVLSQSFNTVAGGSYTLSFNYQKIFDGNTGTFRLQYKIIDDVTAATVLSPANAADNTNNSTPNGGWLTVSTTFTGTGNSVKLTLTDMSDIGGSGYDGLLDNVSVTGSSTLLVASPVSGNTIDFGTLNPSQMLTQFNAVSLSNNGDPTTTINVTGISFGGANAGLFSSPDYANTTLTAGGASNVQYDLKFLGASPGDYNATVTFNTSAGDVNYNLHVVVIPAPSPLTAGLGLLALAGLRRRMRHLA